MKCCKKFRHLFCKIMFVRMLCLLAALSSHYEASAQVSTLPQISTKDILAMDPIDAYVFLDQNFNVRARLRDETKIDENLMKDKEKLAVDLHFYQMDISKVSALESAFQNDLNNLFKPTQDSILVPVLEEDRTQFESLTGINQPFKTVKAKKLLGRKSYLILPGQGMPLATIKVLDYVPRIEQKAYRSVLNNDYIKQYESKLPVRLQNLTLEETGTYQIKNNLRIPYTYILRDMSHLNENSTHVRVLPGHGLLGCESCIESLAGAKNMTVIEWKKNIYIPKLAEVTAWYNIAMGVSTELHTQNMVLKVNFQTGDVEKIFIRDLSDVLIDPLVMLAKNEFKIDPRWDKLDYNSIHRNEFADWTVPEAKDMWYNIAIYTGQAIDSHAQGFKARRNLNRIFLKEYIKVAESIIGQPIHLSDDAVKVMASLEAAESYETLYTGNLADRGRYRNALASVIKSVYEQYETILMNKIEKNPIESEQQSALSKDLIDAISKGQIRYVSDEAKNTLLPLYSKAMGQMDRVSENLAPIYQGTIKSFGYVAEKNRALKFNVDVLKLKSLRGFYKFYSRILNVFEKHELITQINEKIALKLNPRQEKIEDDFNKYQKKQEAKDLKRNTQVGFQKDALKATLNSYILKHLAKLTFGIDLGKYSFKSSKSGTLVVDRMSGETLAVIFNKPSVKVMRCEGLFNVN